MSGGVTTARLEVRGEKFEILVNSNKAFQYKVGKRGFSDDILAIDVVYVDASKGEKASEEKLRRAFGTTDRLRIAKEILDKGELQITAEQRRRLIEDKRKQIINYISRNFVDPKTNLPHPPVRVEQALKQARVSIDPFKPVEEQIKRVIESIRPMIPLKTGVIKLKVRVPAGYAPKAYGVLRSYGDVVKEEWLSDGSLSAVIQLPIASQGALVDRLSSITKGAVSVNPVED